MAQYRAWKVAVVAVVALLSATACGQYDEAHKVVVEESAVKGQWANGEGGTIALNTDGSFTLSGISEQTMFASVAGTVRTAAGSWSFFSRSNVSGVRLAGAWNDASPAPFTVDMALDCHQGKAQLFFDTQQPASRTNNFERTEGPAACSVTSAD
ncbi:hypothetical protein ACIF6L_09725 [Kitasatospora sp. NPDC086009]|uniref:hypothetical protein n=1 Tax=unclassified Kitasatospora TaxID=2633591 RepID=UPI0037CA188F